MRSVSARDKHCSLLHKSVKIHICPSLTFEGEITRVVSGEPLLVKRLWYLRSVSASDKHCSLLLKSVKIHICPSLIIEGEATRVESVEP
jgi:hypothetical protein